MSIPPPPLPSTRNPDLDQLRVLAVLHFVSAGLAVLGLGFILLHYLMMNATFGNPEFWKHQKAPGPDLEQFFAIFKWLYLLSGVFFLFAAAANLLSGLFIQKRKHRTFSLIVAGINCIRFPLGTALGAFAFVVLLRDSVRELYEGQSHT